MEKINIKKGTAKIIFQIGLVIFIFFVILLCYLFITDSQLIHTFEGFVALFAIFSLGFSLFAFWFGFVKS